MVPRFGMAAALLAIVFLAAGANAAEPGPDPAQKAAQEAAQEAARKEAARKEATQKAAEESTRRSAEAQALQAELQKVVVTDLDPAGDGPPPQAGDQKVVQIWHRKQHIRAMATNIERQAMVTFMGELELIRQTCGSLPPDLRRRALEAGTLALRKAALDAANAQSAGRQPANAAADDMGIEAVRALLAAGVPAEELAAYDAERQSRAARRRQRARVLTIAHLDAELDLSADQRTTIAAALDKAWRDDWTTAVDCIEIHQGQFAPDFAVDCIVPNLTPRQLAAWKTWSGQRSWKTLTIQNPQLVRAKVWHGHWQGTGGLPPDDWWRE